MKVTNNGYNRDLSILFSPSSYCDSCTFVPCWDYKNTLLPALKVCIFRKLFYTPGSDADDLVQNILITFRWVNRCEIDQKMKEHRKMFTACLMKRYYIFCCSTVVSSVILGSIFLRFCTVAYICWIFMRLIIYQACNLFCNCFCF